MAQQIFDKSGNANIAALIEALRPTAVEAQAYINESRALAQRVSA